MIPMLDWVLKKLSELGFEKSMQQRLLADSVRLGPRQLPEVWYKHISAYESLDSDLRPELYVTNHLDMNAMTIGSAKPIVIVYSGMVKGAPDDQLTAVLAHEAGHVLSEHYHYRTMMLVIQMLLQGSGAIAPLAGLPLWAVYIVLLEWYRCAELSCDRAATLVVDDPLITCRVLMGLAGGGIKELDLDAFLQQAAEFNDSDDLLTLPGRWLNELTRTHPYTVKRVGELMRWVQEGELDRIRAGSYVRRGQEPPTSEHMKAATEHYRKRFMEVLDKVGSGAQRLANQVAGWIRPGSGGEGDGRN
jgi:Zn-dependent protease with chaperone function